MALPMDEQRILEEMERTLAAEDPRLAARLASFGRPGFGQVLRSRRARSLVTLAIFAIIALLIYAMSTLRFTVAVHGPGSGQHVSRVVGARPAAQAPSAAQCGATVEPRACIALRTPSGRAAGRTPAGK